MPAGGEQRAVSVLTGRDLAKSFGPHDVFERISCEIPQGAKIALVGPNGSGKTTLLRLLAGLETPSAGVVERARGVRIGYLPQHADFPGAGTLWEAMLEVFAPLRAQAAELRRIEACMAAATDHSELLTAYGRAQEKFELAGGYTYEQRIRQVLAGLGFDSSDLHCPLAHLSGGQKTRALLARLLLEEPGLLLMDEPINHLDLAGIEWLEGYLRSWRGALVAVAHDRAFLDAFAQEVWDLAWGGLEQYRGNYSAYMQQKAEGLERQQADSSGSSRRSARLRTSSGATWPGNAPAKLRAASGAWRASSASINRGTTSRCT
jgi:ATP-binding cassette, subfamily F, member 3